MHLTNEHERAGGVVVAGPLLRCDSLTVDIPTSAGLLRVLDGVTFDIDHGRVLGVIGESGSGKSVTALAITRLLSAETLLGGEVRWKNEDLFSVTETRMREVRGRQIAMIFQNPLTSLNPTQRVGKQIAESLSEMSRAAKRAKTIELLSQVGIKEASKRVDSYPHQLSGGQRQRVMIAMALAAEPDLLIADEATTALDVTVQARILELLEQIRIDRGLAMIMVSHDLRVVANVADDVLVMYAGRVCERGATEQVIARPAHPYTRALRDNVPSVRSSHSLGDTLQGAPVGPSSRPSGCAFRTRCPMATMKCASEVPRMREVDGRMVACHRAEEVLEGVRL